MTRFRTVLFDCDSTLTALEGIDRLGAGHPRLAQLTAAAMSGEIRLEEAYRQRLELVRPGRDAIARLGAEYIANAVEDAHEVIGALHRAGADVHVVSGGLRGAVAAFAEALGIPAENAHAVDLHFDADGHYVGFDDASPLARSGGKAELLAALASRVRPPVLLVGDGVTDLEAAPAVDLFVAYTGVVDRPAVSAAADVVIRSRSLAPVLLLAIPDEGNVAAADRPLHAKARQLATQHVVDRRAHA